MRQLACHCRVRARALAGAALFVAALALSAVQPAPAAAQGFFQQLFGISSPAPRPSYRLGVPPARERAEDLQSHETRRDQSRTERDSGGRKYRTMCVRLCDGYYFPISNATTHQTFVRDANHCEASCGAEARLFYMPSGDSDAAEMTDLTGLSYSALPNAFKYRKTLVSGCSCKPMPWSEAARARHRGYAMAEARARGEIVPSRRPSDEEPAVARSYELPPPVSGPGVMVISAGGVATAAEAPAAPREVDEAEISESSSAGDATAEPAHSVAEARPYGKVKSARPKVTVINASLPQQRQRHARAQHAVVKSAGFLGAGLFASEPRRIVYPGQRVRQQH
jgi:hypothetical protein